MLSVVNHETHSKTYDSLEKKYTKKEPPSSQPDIPLHIEKPLTDIVIRPPKSTLRKTTHNPNARVAQHYSIVEDLAQAPCAMSTLEVLQTFPMQQKSLLSVIGGLVPMESNLITFDTEHKTPRLSHQLTFQIQVMVMKKIIHRTVVDEGESTSLMSISCWKALDSPPITPSPIILIAFDG